MFGKTKITTTQRPNPAGRNCTVVCLFAKGKKMQSDQDMTTLTCAMLEDTNLLFAEKRERGSSTIKPKPDNLDHPYPAGTNSHYVKLFNCSASEFDVGQAYDLIGCVLERFVPPPEANKDYQYLDNIIAASSRKATHPVEYYVPSIPFDQRCFNVERDFPYDISKYNVNDPSGVVFMHIVHTSECNKEVVKEPSIEDDWFPNQPNGSIWAKINIDIKSVSTEFKNLAGVVKPCMMQSDGTNGSPFQMYIRQIDEKGNKMKIIGSTSLYEGAIKTLETRYWKELASVFITHLTGFMTASMNREKTMNMVNPDQNIVNHYAHINSAFVADLGKIVRECGTKVNASVAKKLVDLYGSVVNDRIFHNKTMTAMNLCYVRLSDADEKIYDDTAYDYYVVSNSKWSNYTKKEVMELPEDEIVKVFSNEVEKYQWPEGIEQAIEVYRTNKTEAKDEAKDEVTEKKPASKKMKSANNDEEKSGSKKKRKE